MCVGYLQQIKPLNREQHLQLAAVLSLIFGHIFTTARSFARLPTMPPADEHVGALHPLLLQALSGLCQTWSGWQAMARHITVLLPPIVRTLSAPQLRSNVHLLQVGCVVWSIWGCS